MSRWGRHAAAAARPLPLKRAAVGVRGRKIEMRVRRWVAEEVLDDR
jgi:hypothetical protein